MVIDLEHHEEICILRIKGRLAPATDLDYLSSKAAEIDAMRCTKLLGDFHEVAAIGSMGVGFVVSVYNSVNKLPGGRFVLAGVNKRVRRVLELTRVSTIIPMVEDLDAGLNALRE